jgi:hypothetical protein
MAVSVCVTCDSVCDPYFTCGRDARDYCIVHREHGFHNCVTKAIPEKNQKEALSTESIVKLFGGSHADRA